MSCITIFLTAAMWGLPPGSCALHCPLDREFVTPINHSVGYVDTNLAGRILVYRIDGQWRSVDKQAFEQCANGGVQW